MDFQSPALHTLYYIKAFSEILWFRLLTKEDLEAPSGAQLALVLVCHEVAEWRLQYCGHQGQPCKQGKRVPDTHVMRMWRTFLNSKEKIQLLLEHKLHPHSITFVLKIFLLPHTEDKILASLKSMYCCKWVHNFILSCVLLSLNTAKSALPFKFSLRYYHCKTNKEASKQAK